MMAPDSADSKTPESVQHPRLMMSMKILVMFSRGPGVGVKCSAIRGTPSVRSHFIEWDENVVDWLADSFDH